MAEGVQSSAMESNQGPTAPSLTPVEETQETSPQQIGTMPSSEAPNEVSHADTEAEKPSSPNKRGLTSQAWTHFKRQKIEDKWKAICKYCNKKLGGDTRHGTIHLHDHIKSCSVRAVRGPRQPIIKTLANQGRDTFVVGNHTFNQDHSRAELAKMIVLHEYPLAMVDHIGFRRFVASCQPLFTMVSRNTIKSDILKMYESERFKTLALFENNPTRIAITTDMWTSSNQNKGYMSITAHFIDDNWQLQSRLVHLCACTP
ncbi:zinc finger BED domain-containing protein DAYSLEEPER-like [Senna tora]|uniref:Zinc finger BED domain-containing protein DAYSLEEPER-like n=1 Tax=Senna tora TaxID=362788 RepID=A0A834SFQ9_9FABA|nr:zinc finger BED domain-containing protein DAYSLEEPER-like [Senna tora]